MQGDRIVSDENENVEAVMQTDGDFVGALGVMIDPPKKNLTATISPTNRSCLYDDSLRLGRCSLVNRNERGGPERQLQTSEEQQRVSCCRQQQRQRSPTGRYQRKKKSKRLRFRFSTESSTLVFDEVVEMPLHNRTPPVIYGLMTRSLFRVMGPSSRTRSRAVSLRKHLKASFVLPLPALEKA